jgi:hypothetical protein
MSPGQFSKADLTTTNLPLAVNAVRKAAFLPEYADKHSSST